MRTKKSDRQSLGITVLGIIIEVNPVYDHHRENGKTAQDIKSLDSSVRFHSQVCETIGLSVANLTVISHSAYQVLILFCRITGGIISIERIRQKSSRVVLASVISIERYIYRVTTGFVLRGNLSYFDPRISICTRHNLNAQHSLFKNYKYYIQYYC